LGAAQGYVGGGVVIGDMGQADGYLLRFYVGDEPTEIVDYLTIVYRSISTIDVGIHVFYIYYIMVYVWSYSQEMMDIYIKRCFYSDVPVSRFQLTKGYYLITPKQWFATTKGYSSTRSLKVQIVDHHLVKYLLCIHLLPHAIRP
jgi:hypothetical protein